jgi:hypothetical protein
MAARLLAKQARLISRMTKWPQTVAESLNYDDPRRAIQAIDKGLEILANDWEDFRTNHRHLEDDPGIESATYFANDDYEVASMAYVKGAAEFEALRPQQPPSPQIADTSFFRDIARESLPPLPRIELPTFSGAYSEWELFRDAFTTAVVNRNDVSNFHKLQYLKQSLKGTAARIVQNVAVTDANFEPVWKEVCQRYTNSRMLAHAHLVELFDMPALTKSSPVNMRSILDRTKEEVRALEALGCPTQYWDDILVFMTLRRLDDPTRYEWQIDLTNSDKQRKLVDAAYTPALPTFQQLELFLDHRIRALDMSMVESKLHQGVPIFKSVPVKARVHAVGAAPGSPEEQHAPRSDRRPCPVCKEDHMIDNCETFKGCGLEERRGQVNQLGLCFNCLGSHRLKNCKSIVACRTCAQRLHDHDKRPNPPTRAPESSRSASVNMVRLLHQTRVVLLATAQVIVCSPNGKQTQTRALLDSGSETTLIAEHVAHKLQLSRTRSTVNICSIGETAAGSARFQTDVLLKSRVHPDVEYTVTAVILPKLTGCLPRQQIAPVDTLPVNSDDLADPYYFCKAKIGLVLGADIYGLLLRPGLKRSSCKQVAAQDTTLGWIVTASVPTPEPSSAVVQCTSPAETTNELHRFWETEEVSVPEQPLTPEDALCEEHFRETYSRNADRRFVVRLPTRPHALLSGDNNRSSCARSLQALERRFAREPALKETYSSFLTEYERLGHMSVVPPPASDQACWYLPHHAVQQQGPRGTKLRVVFDATRSNNAGCSLNSTLLRGPSLLGDLSLLLLRWRNYRYVNASLLARVRQRSRNSTRSSNSQVDFPVHRYQRDRAPCLLRRLY